MDSIDHRREPGGEGQDAGCHARSGTVRVADQVFIAPQYHDHLFNLNNNNNNNN
jgi:hypothetical protein